MQQPEWVRPSGIAGSGSCAPPARFLRRNDPLIAVRVDTGIRLDAENLGASFEAERPLSGLNDDIVAHLLADEVRLLTWLPRQL